MGVNATGTGCFQNGKKLCSGPHKLVTLVPDVGGHKCVVFRGHFGKLNELIDFGVAAGGISQTEGHTHGAVLNTVAQQLLHALQLLGGGSAVLCAHDSPAYGVVTHKDGAVGTQRDVFDSVKKAAHGAQNFALGAVSADGDGWVCVTG